jgi:uncharacterized phosphosugar-binding protein
MSEPDVAGAPPAHLAYAAAARATIDRIAATQADAIGRAADLCAGAIGRGGLVHLFGSGHSRMAVEEMYPRYGSFAGFHPIVEQSLSNHHQVVGNNGQRQAMFIENTEGFGRVILSNFTLDPRLDVMLVISAGGTNAVPVEIALESEALGLPVIAITSVEHSRASASRHSSGKRLYQVAEIVLDTCTPPGDAAIRLSGLDTPVGPLTSVANVTIINMLKVAIAERLVAGGTKPPVITSSVVAGEERSRELFDASYREYRERTRRL